MDETREWLDVRSGGAGTSGRAMSGRGETRTPREPIVARIESGLAEVPGYERLAAAAFIGEVFVKTIRAAFTPPFSWWRDMLDECDLAVRRCSLPLILSLLFFAVGIVVTLIAGLLGALGTIDRTGAGMVTGWPRETGYWVTAMVFAGVVGSSVTADLGARKIREELDAMSVLGVDYIRTLVVPRVVAVTLIAPVLGLLAIGLAIGTIYLISPFLLPNATYHAYLDSARSIINVGDVLSLILRMLVTGLLVGVVSCAKGLSVKGGAEGVGRAVNQSVLITFLSIWVLNSLWNAVFLPTFPNVTILKG